MQYVNQHLMQTRLSLPALIESTSSDSNGSVYIMVTVEQGSGQFQGTGGATQTRNPQQAPANLQPNGAQQSGLQNVITGSNLFSNPQSNAVITIPGNTSTSAQSLIANEAVPNTQNDISSTRAGIIVGVIALLLLIGGFLIIRKLTADE